MADPEVNPLKQIHDAFWDMLTARSDFTALVPVANRLKVYDEDDLGIGEPLEPDQHLPAAGPSVRILQTGVRYHSHADTSHTALVLIWEIQVLTGRRYLNKMLDVVWSILRATESWADYLGVLTYHGETFARCCRALQSADSLEHAQLHRDIRGWTSVWRGEIECWFLVSDMLDSST